jgi:hypothetical protein
VTIAEGERRGDRLVVPIAEFSGRHLATDYVEYDICAARGSLARGFFYTPFTIKEKNHEPGFRRGLGIDQFGREQIRGPATRGGKGVWEHRVIGLLEGAPGPLPNHAMVFSGNQAGTFTIYIDNLRIRHVDGSTSPIWRDGSDTRFRPPQNVPPGFTDVGIRTVQLANLNTEVDVRPIEDGSQPGKARISSSKRLLLTLLVGALVAVIAYRALKNP